MYTNRHHTFVICAFQESPYLEECILSVINQTVKSTVIISTSTPNKYIKGLADNYSLQLVVNFGIGDLCGNFNFAYSQAKTDIVTLCHQDDKYDPEYLENLLREINKAKKPLLYFTDYYEIKGNKIIQNNKLLKIKRIMLLPLKSSLLQKSKFVRRRILSIGNSICCPSVSFVKNNLPKEIFKRGFKGNIDWQAWENISKFTGEFVYCSKPLTLRRIHESSNTTELISSKLLTQENYEMFCMFWPKPIAKLINRVYTVSEKSNSL